MISIGLIGTQSMHAAEFAKVCNLPNEDGVYSFPNARVVAAYGVDDTPEHTQRTARLGNIPTICNSLEELRSCCDAFMILQRHGDEHMPYASELISGGCPVFIDKPVCSSLSDTRILRSLASEYNAVICGGSGFKHSSRLLELKDRLRAGAFGAVTEAAIHYCADTQSQYDGIFFYLPHTVEIMLELFGYDPVSVKTSFRAHDDFTVHVSYEDRVIDLVLQRIDPAIVVINGRTVTHLESSDIFRQTMARFINAIETGAVTKDTGQLIRHVQVICAVREALKTGEEILIRE